MSHRFLVLGSNSFCGASFVRHLLIQGDDVIGVSRSPEADAVFLPYRWLQTGQGKFRFHKIDLNHDLDRLMVLLDEFRPAYIVNFAAQGMVAQSWQIPEHWYQTNVVAQVRLHDQLRKRSFVRKYVHFTTPEVYGSTEGWIGEHFHFAPSTPYAVSRAACDLHLMSFFRAYEFPVVFTRAANVYGPGQQLYRIIPRSMLFARAGRRLQLHGGGRSLRAFIQIDDVADATRRIALRGEVGSTYHISTRSTVSIRELVERICALTGVPFDRLTEFSEDRLGKDHAYLLDSRRLRETLDWEPRMGLDDGLRQTLDWIDTNLHALQSRSADYEHKA